MKKIFYLLSSLMLVFTACDPMEETFEELDKIADAPRNFAITLSTADYQALKGKDGVPGYVSTDFYFASEQEAGAIVPIFLNSKYAYLNDKDAIDVTYNTSAYAAGKAVAERVSYTLATSEDYALGGALYGRTNFDSWTQIETFLKAKYSTPLEGRLATLTFTWYNSNAAYPKPDGSGTTQSKTVTESFFYSGGKWYDTYVVTDADYVTAERTRNYAFASGDEAEYVPAVLNNVLKKNIIGAKAGDIKYATYKVRYSSSSTLQEVMPMYYDGANWKKVTPTVTTEATLTFKKKNGTWVPDPIIRYTLVAADYTWISKQPELGTEPQLANLGDPRYLNFYQSWSGNDYYWSNEDIYKALAGFLKYKFPNAEVGSKYSVTYAYYLSGNKVGNVVFIKNEAGEFELFVEE